MKKCLKAIELKIEKKTTGRYRQMIFISNQKDAKAVAKTISMN